MGSRVLVCALLVFAACSKDNGDSNTGSTDDSNTGDDSGSNKVDADKDGYPSTEDCDDTNAAVHPDAKEVCDEIDNNCMGGIDEGVTTAFYADGDGDGHGAGEAMDACSAPTGYVESSDDCDDAVAAAYPGNTEVCDGIDNNCDLATDEGVTTPFYMDGDGDGYGAGKATDACTAPTGYVDNADDCDDTSRSVTGSDTYWADSDGDGYGDYYTATTACGMPSGYVADSSDCNDDDSSWHEYELAFYDFDLDGYGSGSTKTLTCTSDYYATEDGDCAEFDAAINPGATEICNDEDDNCDGDTDEDDPAIVYTTWYYDGDEDGYGDSSTATDTCDPKAGYVTLGDDCDDGAYLVSPGRAEYCDGIDNNCDGASDETTDYVDWYRDDDGDHYGTESEIINDCEPQKGYDPTAGDCDDGDASVNPRATESVGDDVDDQCDGFIDNGEFDLDNAMFSLSGTKSSDAGESVAGGDLDGDGTDDLIVGAPIGATYPLGAVYIVNGPASGGITVADVDASITGSGVGHDVTSRDVNSDGFDDLLASNSGDEAFLFMGPVTSWDTSSADTTFDPLTYGVTHFGDAIALANLDGDSYLETAIGELDDLCCARYGNVYLYTGPTSGSVSSPDLLVTGSTMGGFASEVANLGDIDADGLDDLAIGAFYGLGGGEGEVFVLDDPSGMTGTTSPSSLAVATITGENTDDNFGFRLAGGDYNDDGTDDLFVSAPFYDNGTAYDSGRVYGWLGPVSGTLSASSADVMVAGELPAGRMGYGLALGDVGNGPGDDVVIGQPAPLSVGQAYLLSGPTSGSLDPSAMTSIGSPDGVESGDLWIGWAVGTMGDWSGDEYDEVLIHGRGIASYGRAWVVSSDDL